MGAAVRKHQGDRRKASGLAAMADVLQPYLHRAVYACRRHPAVYLFSVLIMRREFRYAVVFACILATAVLFYSTYLKGIITGSRAQPRQKICRVFSHEIDASLMVFGSSVVLLGVNTPLLEQVTGLDSCNMGLDGTKYHQYEVIIDEYLSYTRRCSAMLFVQERLHLTKASFLYQPIFYRDLLDHPGVYAAFARVDSALAFGLRFVPGYALNHAFASKEVLERFLDMNRRLVRRNIRPIVIVPPFYSRDGLGAEGPTRRRMREQFQSVGAEVLDYSGMDLIRSKEFFADVSHLNAAGAEVFTNMLAGDIAALNMGKK